MKIKGLAHIGLFVKNAEDTCRFYEEILDFEEVWRNINPSPEGDVHVIFIKKDDFIIEVVQLPNPENRGDGWFDHISIAVEDIEGVIKKLEEKGVEFEQGSFTAAPQVFENGSKWVMFRGPNNEHLELNEKLQSI